MPSSNHAPISIWFFIGLLLDVYGVLILGASLHDLAVPPEHPVVLANLHAGIWWGAVLIVLGLVYTYVFLPSRHAARDRAVRNGEAR
jgi:Zn-dependent membrane protease YugP